MKNFFNYILVSISTILVGFSAMALPFKLFDELSRTEMKVLFFAELFVYFAIFSLCLILKEKQKERKLKEQKLKELHNIRVLEREKEMQGLSFNNIDLVA